MESSCQEMLRKCSLSMSVNSCANAAASISTNFCGNSLNALFSVSKGTCSSINAFADVGLNALSSTGLQSSRGETIFSKISFLAPVAVKAKTESIFRVLSEARLSFDFSIKDRIFIRSMITVLQFSGFFYILVGIIHCEYLRLFFLSSSFF